MTENPSTKQGIASGTSIGAAAIMVTVGLIQFFQGLAAVLENEMFVVGVQYVYKFDLTTWGWIHLILGILVAAVSILANFLWLPYYPAWSLLIIALDVVVIWAVAAWQPDRA